MVTTTNSALDLSVLEIRLLLLDLALVFGAGLPVRDRPECNVLRDAGGVGLRAGGLALLLPEFCPLFPLRDGGVDALLDGGLLDASCGLYLLAIFDSVGYDGFGAVFVLNDLLGGNLEGGILVVVLGPVAACYFRHVDGKYGVCGWW